MIPPLLALFSWPLIAIVFFRTMRLPVAIIVTILGGYLLLAPRIGFDLPFLPTLSKESVPALAAILLAFVFGRSASGTAGLPGLLPRHRMAQLLLLLLALAPFLTVLTNTDPVVLATQRLQPLTLFDGFSMTLSAAMATLPLLLARKYLAGSEAQRLLLTVICVAALGYSLLALIEVRLSPQLNNWVYGFFPHNWLQHIRGDGYRPVVFLGHGLILGIFLACAVLASAGLTRIDAARRGRFLLATLWLLLTLLLSKNFGALLVCLMLLPAALFLGPRPQLLAAAAIAGLFLFYPAIRSANVLPVERIVTLAESVDPQRASSLRTRLFNEDRLLAKALDRPLFGWGPWARSRYQNEQGEDVSITDGMWVITLGLYGWAGYVARFGLLVFPILLLVLNRRRQDVGPESAALALVLAANLLDLIPNSGLTPLTWLIAGSLWGRLELGAAASRDVPQAAPQARPGYRRDPAAPGLAREAEAPPDAADGTPHARYTRQKQRIERRRPPRPEGSR